MMPFYNLDLKWLHFVKVSDYVWEITNIIEEMIDGIRSVEQIKIDPVNGETITYDLTFQNHQLTIPQRIDFNLI
jgi:hypothetical protein